MDWGNKFVLFSIASFSLLAAFAVYCFMRIYPPEILTPLLATSSNLSSYTGISGSAPSFFYTLSIGLLVGVCASTLLSATRHCLLWVALALSLEMSQHPSLAETISNWLATVVPESGWEIVGPYWTRGVFDPWDLIATLVGGLIALVLLTYLPREKHNEHVR